MGDSGARSRRDGQPAAGAPLRWQPGVVALAALPAGLALQWLLAERPALVEDAYARGVYPALSGALACVTSALPFSVAEALLALLVALAACGVVRVARTPRGRRRRTLASGALGLAALGCVGYLSFVLLWGLNYRRAAFADSAGLDASPASVTELEAVSAALVREANTGREGLPEDDRGRLRLPQGSAGTLARVAAGFAAASAELPFLDVACVRPRAAWTSPLLARLGIAGLYVPFTAEPHVNVTLPAAQLPFSAAHEVAHLAGFAREDEANYVGYLACRRHPDADFRYSGLLAASAYAQAALSHAAPEAARRIEQLRSDGVRRDLDALREWTQRYEGRVSRASRRVNDAYLKSQGQREGVASYGRMVDLLIAERRQAGTDQ